MKEAEVMSEPQGKEGNFGTSEEKKESQGIKMARGCRPSEQYMQDLVPRRSPITPGGPFQQTMALSGVN